MTLCILLSIQPEWLDLNFLDLLSMLNVWLRSGYEPTIMNACISHWWYAAKAMIAGCLGFYPFLLWEMEGLQRAMTYETA